MLPPLRLLSAAEPIDPVLERSHGLLEAPRAAADGSLLYSDVTGGGVFELGHHAEPVVVVPKRRGVGGLVAHRDGGVVVSGRTVLHVSGGEQRELLAIEGVQGFNDLTTDADGRVLVGALRFRPMAGESPVPGEVWRIDGQDSATVVAEGIDWPNGVGLSPDGGLLYVSDTAHGVVRAFRVDGASSAEEFARVPQGVPDGLGVDEAGGVWVALGAGGIARFDPDGRLDGVAALPTNFVSSLCFGGPDYRDVYITTADSTARPDTGGSVFHARSEVAGLSVGDAAI